MVKEETLQRSSSSAPSAAHPLAAPRAPIRRPAGNNLVEWLVSQLQRAPTLRDKPWRLHLQVILDSDSLRVSEEMTTALAVAEETASFSYRGPSREQRGHPGHPCKAPLGVYLP
jgi:hypothetical protein